MRGLFSGSGGAAPGGTPAAARPAAAPAPAQPVAGSGIDRPIRPNRPHVLAAGDPAARLPAEAAEKLARLRRDEARIGVVLRDLAERQMAAGAEKQRAEAYLTRLQHSHVQPSGGPRPSSFMRGATEVTPHVPPVASDRQIAEAERDVEAAKAKLQAINAEIAELEASRSRLPAEIDRWLDRLPADTRISAVSGKPAGRSKPATFADVETLRDKIDQSRAAISQTKAAPPPSATVKQRMREQISALAEKGAPNLLPAVELGRDIQFPQMQTPIQVATPAGAGMGTHYGTDMLSLFCWLHRDAIIKKMESDISELADDEHAMSDDDKARRIRELEAEILELERAEVAAAEECGAMLRDDTDPRAVLRIELR